MLHTLDLVEESFESLDLLAEEIPDQFQFAYAAAALQPATAFCASTASSATCLGSASSVSTLSC